MKNKFLGLIGGAGLVILGGCAQPPPAGAAVQAGAPIVAPGDPGNSADVSASVQAEGPVAAPDNISPGAAEVIRLASSGVDQDVIIAYVNNVQTPFALTADQVVYLKDLGISPDVVTAMINRDSALRAQPATVASTAPPPPLPAEPAPPVVEAPMTPVVETAPPEDVSYFYNDLAPYGTWVTLPGIGWCWQPRTVVISHGWRPYCDGGHWVYSDCGWYWESDYSWGWAPFHYGRWYLDAHCGWVWTPDRVWGPAWVCWREGGDHCGWAPLPPHAVFDVHTGWRFNGVRVGINFDFGLRPDHFTFVAVRDFTHHDLGHHVVAVNQVRTVYRQTTIINNTTVVHNNVIVNRGIPVDKVASVTHTQIRPAVLHDSPAGSGSIHDQRPAGGGNETVVYRHELPAKPKPLKVAAERVDASHPVINHTELSKVRTDRIAGSTPPQPRGKAPVTASRDKAPAAPLIMRGNKSPAAPNTEKAQAPASHPGPSVAEGGTPPVVEGPRTPGRNVPTRDAQKPVMTSKPIEMPRPEQPRQNYATSDYGRYGNPARTAPVLPSPKQSPPETSSRYSGRSTENDSPRSSTTHDYVPKGGQQRTENYSPPAPRAYSAPGRSDQSQSYSRSESSHSGGGGSSSQGNSNSHESRNDSGSKGKDR